MTIVLKQSYADVYGTCVDANCVIILVLITSAGFVTKPATNALDIPNTIFSTTVNDDDDDDDC